MRNNLVFVHDHKFRKIENKFYSTGGLSSKALERYTKIFGNIVVIARVVDEIETADKYSEIINENVNIVNGSTLSKKDFESIIKNSDRVISRMPSLFGYKAIIASKKYKIPYMIEVVGCAWDALWNHSLKGKVLAIPSFIIMKILVYKSSHTIYVTNEFLQKRYPTSGKTTNCSNVSLNEFDDNKIKDRLNKISGLKSHDKIVIGTTAAIDVRYKGQQYVIEALGELKKEGKTNFEYQLVGGGDSNYLRNKALKFNVIDQVIIKGSMPHDDVFDWLDNIDLYVQPSKQEGLPRALIESMSRGLPAFGARTAGIPELLEKDYIFSNSKNNIKEIVNILKLFSKDKMHQQAITNFNESKNYASTIIENRRSKFLLDFKESSARNFD